MVATGVMGWVLFLVADAAAVVIATPRKYKPASIAHRIICGVIFVLEILTQS